MTRLAMRLAAVFFPAAVILAVLPALPASASQGGVCETFGSQCIGAASSFIGAGDNAINVGSPGRTIVFSPGPGGTGTLHSASQTGLCLAPKGANDHTIAWRLCNVTGVSWSWVAAGTTHYFVSVHYGLRLSGDDTRGDNLTICPAGGCNGSFTLQQWTGP